MQTKSRSLATRLAILGFRKEKSWYSELVAEDGGRSPSDTRGEETREGQVVKGGNGTLDGPAIRGGLAETAVGEFRGVEAE